MKPESKEKMINPASQDMFQVAAVPVNALSCSRDEVVDDPFTLCWCDSTHCNFYGIFHIFCCFKLTSKQPVLQVTPKMKIQGVQVRTVGAPGTISAATDPSVLKVITDPLQGLSGYMRCSPILLKPLMLSRIRSSELSKPCPELGKHPGVAIAVDSHCVLVLIFKKEGFNNTLVAHGHPNCHLLVMEPFLVHLIWRRRTPKDMVFIVDMAVEIKWPSSENQIRCWKESSS